MIKQLLLGSMTLLLILSSCKKENPDPLLKDELKGDGTFVYEGRTYVYKKLLGDYGWMIENLAYLPSVSPSSDESETEPRYYVYGYEGTSVLAAKATENYKKYGVLYNLAAAKTACPPGWHLPSDLEWRYLLNHNLDANIPEDLWIYGPSIYINGWGKFLKSTTGWLNANGTNDIGFTVIPAGTREHYEGSFIGFRDLGYGTAFWAYPDDDSGWSWSWDFWYDPEWGDLHHQKDPGTFGFSVRCLEDWE